MAGFSIVSVLLMWYNTAWVVSIMQWDDKFDSTFFAPE